MGGTTVTGFTGFARPLVVRTPWSRQGQTGGGGNNGSGLDSCKHYRHTVYAEEWFPVLCGLHATAVFKGHQ